MKTKADVEKIALAAEADAGHALPGLRESIAEANAGEGRVTPAEVILERTGGLPRQAVLRMDPDEVLAGSSAGKGRA